MVVYNKNRIPANLNMYDEWCNAILVCIVHDLYKSDIPLQNE